MCGSKGWPRIAIALAVAFWLGCSWTGCSSRRRACGCGDGRWSRRSVLWVAYRFLLRRVFVRLTDASFAVLLERRFPELGDHMLTAVDMAAPDADAASLQSGAGCVGRNEAAAEAIDQRERRRSCSVAGRSCGRSLRRCCWRFRFRSLRRLVERRLSYWMQRIALEPEPWPRRVHLEVVGFPAR